MINTYQCLRYTELTFKMISDWKKIKNSNSLLSSPYFCPEFTGAVSNVRDNVFVTVIQAGDDFAGFFPFERLKHGFGRPVGGKLSDYHAPIVDPGSTIDFKDLLRFSGIKSWSFNHLPHSFLTNGVKVRGSAQSPQISLNGGWHEYRREIETSGSKVLKKNDYYLRRLQRDLGEITISHNTESLETLHTLIKWKSSQYQRSGVIDLFSYDWARQLLFDIAKETRQEFRGIISEMRLGKELVAAHFGMGSGPVWHWWFPAYDPRFSRYSPGMVLLVDALENAENLGINIIDLGKGISDYKMRLSNASAMLDEGEIYIPSLSVLSRQTARYLKNAARKSCLQQALKIPLKRYLYRKRMQEYN
jgi:CelD/BcsL family acetyltransferase involved in cellulose biosynthesis